VIGFIFKRTNITQHASDVGPLSPHPCDHKPCLLPNSPCVTVRFARGAAAPKRARRHKSQHTSECTMAFHFHIGDAFCHVPPANTVQSRCRAVHPASRVVVQLLPGLSHLLGSLVTMSRNFY
jgi:hypothetical protein